MIKFSLFLRVFLQVIFAQNILGSSSDILQLKYPDLQTLVTQLTDDSQTDHGGSLLQSVEQSLSTDGAFAVSELPQDYLQSVIELQNSAPECLQSSSAPVFSLPDGSTRRTWARDNMEQDLQFPDCVKTPAEVVHQTFTSLDSLVSHLIMRIAGHGNTNWMLMNQPEHQQIRGDFASQHYKEHIHVYNSSKWSSSDKSSVTAFATPFHVDSGLLLFLTPFKKHPVIIKNRNDEVINTDNLEDGDVIVIIASALPNWLLKDKDSSSKFFASPHAVPSLESDLSSRTVFARMKIVPDTAVPVSESGDHHHGDKVEFGDYFAGKIRGQRDLEDMSVCPLTPAPSSLPPSLPLQQEWSQLKRTECETNKAFCWMNCLDLPPSDQCSFPANVVCLNVDDKQCCTDDVTENCANMDSSCRWQCGNNTGNHGNHGNHVSDGGHNKHGQHVQQVVVEEEDKFCNGAGTDMFMQGFQTSGNSKQTCVILLFNSWILDTRLKFIFACIGVIILGIGIEAMLMFRRRLQKRRILPRINGLYRRVGVVALFGVNIASGYFAMLVAMTYSVELFICMIVGLVIGHGIFNTGAAVGESVDPCCASQALSNDTSDARHDEASIMSA